VPKLPDFEGLAIFAKVVQMHSFVGAATQLRLSKATVSKAISRIERKLGARLFNRAARRLAVTEAGRQLYDRAARIPAEGEAGRRRRHGAISRAARPEPGDGGQAKLEKHIAYWLGVRGHKASPSTIRSHVGRWIREFRDNPEAD